MKYCTPQPRQMEFSLPVDQGIDLFQRIRERFPLTEFRITSTANGLHDEELKTLEAIEKAKYLAAHSNQELLDDLITRQHASDDKDYQTKGTPQHLSQTSLCLARRLDRTRVFGHVNPRSCEYELALFAWRHVVETLNYLAKPLASPLSAEMEKLADQLLSNITQSGLSFESAPQTVDLGIPPVVVAVPVS